MPAGLLEVFGYLLAGSLSGGLFINWHGSGRALWFFTLMVGDLSRSDRILQEPFDFGQGKG